MKPFQHGLEKKDFHLGKHTDPSLEFYASNAKDAAELTDNTDQVDLIPGVPGTTHKNPKGFNMSTVPPVGSSMRVKKKNEGNETVIDPIDVEELPKKKKNSPSKQSPSK